MPPPFAVQPALPASVEMACRVPPRYRLRVAPPTPPPPSVAFPNVSSKPVSAARRIEKALRRFRKSTNMVGHLRIIRNRKQFESNHDKKIRKAKESAMRGARERRNARKRF